MVLRNGSALSESLALSAASDEPSTSQPIRVDELDHYDEDWIRPFPLKDGVRIRKGEKFSDYYTLFEEIGEGKFGKVYRCIEKATGLTLAAKCIKIRKDTDFEKVEKEVNIMTQMRHKCIAQIYDAFATDSNDVILIMEIVQGGELFDRVADDSYILTEMAVALIMFQICEAIRYIHSQNIIHLDLKPENIMCVSQTSNKIKLIDFGLAQWYDGSKDLMFMAGTPEFAAPEVIKYEPLDFHTDMCLSGQSPFLGETLAHTYCNVEKGRWMFCEEFRENGISDDAKDFISRLLIVEKEKRILPDECLRHRWLLKNRERAALAGAASRAISPALLPCQQPLAVEKLRSYVKNKRFRRLVFGVLFVNSVMRMLRTLQQNKSSHGIDYVRNMLAVAECCPEREDESSILLKAFTKKRGGLTPTPEKTPERRPTTPEANGKELITANNRHKPEEEVKIIVKEKEEKLKEQLSQTPTTTRRKVKKERDGDLAKKRSKSEARRTVDQQRTRSSTEHTSTKKQKQEDNEVGEENIKKISKSSLSKSCDQQNQKPTELVEKQKQSSSKSPQPQQKNIQSGINVMKLAKHLEEPQTINALTKIKQQQDNQQQQVPSTNNNSFVSKMLQRLEQQRQEQIKNKNEEQPLTFAVAAVPLKKEENLIKSSPKVDRKFLNWREEVAMRAEGKYVAEDLIPYERERSHTTTEKRKKLVKRKVSKVKTAEDENRIKDEEKMEIEENKIIKKENKQNGHYKNKKEERMELDNDLIKPQTPRTKKKLILVRKRRESTVTPTDGSRVEKEVG
uniref:Protein kinase domain-containing protein n=1 Tax=Meloidogyne hapla TaxID=6305 RepID=A0A1I8B6J6_MELHA